MKKMLKSVLSLPVLFSLFFLGGCLEEGALGDLNGNENQPGENVGEITQLNQIYELAKAQGFEGSYEDWLDSLKGDAIELRVSKDGQYIQWKHSSSSGWTNLIPLSQITGEDGQDGEDGKDGVDGEDGEDGLTPYIGETGGLAIETLKLVLTAKAIKVTMVKMDKLHTLVIMDTGGLAMLILA